MTDGGIEEHGTDGVQVGLRNCEVGTLSTCGRLRI